MSKGATVLGSWAGLLGVRLIWAGAILLAFLVSLVLPVAYEMGKSEGIPGFIIAAVGWMGVFKGQFGWFANFGILAAFVFLLVGRRIPLAVALILAIPTLVCLVNAAMWREVPVSEQWFTVRAFGSGYWLWMAIVAASIVAMLAMVRPPVLRS